MFTAPTHSMYKCGEGSGRQMS